MQLIPAILHRSPWTRTFFHRFHCFRFANLQILSRWILGLLFNSKEPWCQCLWFYLRSARVLGLNISLLSDAGQYPYILSARSKTGLLPSLRTWEPGEIEQFGKLETLGAFSGLVFSRTMSAPWVFSLAQEVRGVVLRTEIPWKLRGFLRVV